MDVTSKRWLAGMREMHRSDYLVEVELADALRRAPASARPKAYIATHEELFRRLPDHPHLTVDEDLRSRVDAMLFLEGVHFRSCPQNSIFERNACVLEKLFGTKPIGANMLRQDHAVENYFGVGHSSPQMLESNRQCRRDAKVASLPGEHRYLR